MTVRMTSRERVLTALSHREPDRVPVLLPLTGHGASELGMGIEAYFSHPDNVIEGQLRMRRRLGHDVLLGFFYAGVEHEAFGGDVIYAPGGPPNAGRPVIGSREDIFRLVDRDPAQHPRLRDVLATLRGLAHAAKGEVLVMGAVIAPASLPVMLMGFEGYLVLLHEDPEAATRLLEVTRTFCLRWARAQLEAGADALGYFDPLSSTTISSARLFEERIHPLNLRTIAEIDGPVALHLASGRTGERLEALVASGAVALGVSTLEDLAAIKRVCAGRVALVGNLNGVAMARWSPEEAAKEATAAIRAAAPGGGFLLSDNHGEIPYPVDWEVLEAIMEAARTAGAYPIGGGRCA